MQAHQNPALLWWVSQNTGLNFEIVSIEVHQLVGVNLFLFLYDKSIIAVVLYTLIFFWTEIQGVSMLVF